MRARLTTMPAKKNGTAMAVASVAQTNAIVSEKLNTGARLSCTPSDSAIVTE